MIIFFLHKLKKKFISSSLSLDLRSCFLLPSCISFFLDKKQSFSFFFFFNFLVHFFFYLSHLIPLYCRLPGSASPLLSLKKQPSSQTPRALLPPLSIISCRTILLLSLSFYLSLNLCYTRTHARLHKER